MQEGNRGGIVRNIGHLLCSWRCCELDTLGNLWGVTSKGRAVVVLQAFEIEVILQHNSTVQPLIVYHCEAADELIYVSAPPASSTSNVLVWAATRFGDIAVVDGSSREVCAETSLHRKVLACCTDNERLLVCCKAQEEESVVVEVSLCETSLRISTICFIRGTVTCCLTDPLSARLLSITTNGNVDVWHLRTNCCLTDFYGNLQMDAILHGCATCALILEGVLWVGSSSGEVLAAPFGPCFGQSKFQLLGAKQSGAICNLLASMTGEVIWSMSNAGDIVCWDASARRATTRANAINGCQALQFFPKLQFLSCWVLNGDGQPHLLEFKVPRTPPLPCREILNILVELCNNRGSSHHREELVAVAEEAAEKVLKDIPGIRFLVQKVAKGGVNPLFVERPTCDSERKLGELEESASSNSFRENQRASCAEDTAAINRLCGSEAESGSPKTTGEDAPEDEPKALPLPSYVLQNCLVQKENDLIATSERFREQAKALELREQQLNDRLKAQAQGQRELMEVTKALQESQLHESVSLNELQRLRELHQSELTALRQMYEARITRLEGELRAAQTAVWRGTRGIQRESPTKYSHESLATPTFNYSVDGERFVGDSGCTSAAWRGQREDIFDALNELCDWVAEKCSEYRRGSHQRLVCEATITRLNFVLQRFLRGVNSESVGQRSAVVTSPFR